MISLASGSEMTANQRISTPISVPIPAPAVASVSTNQGTKASSRLSSFFKPVRNLVSGSRPGPATAGLDMSYITPRILAMGFPAAGIEAAIRNPRNQVLEYFKQYHADSYLVFNLCSESRCQYERTIFAHRGASEGAVSIPIKDHGVPSLYRIADFCQQSMNWLNQNNENIVVVHCLTGKGRTGLMVACLLIASRVCLNTPEAISLYNEMRSKEFESVKLPSQLRYVKLFEELLTLSNFSVPLSVTSLSVAKYSWSLVGIELGPTKAVLQSVKVSLRGIETPFQIELPLLLQQRLKNQQSILSSFVERKEQLNAEELIIKAEFGQDTAFHSSQDAQFTIKLKKNIKSVPVKFWLCSEMSQTMINHRSTSDGMATFFFNSEDLDSPSNIEKSLLASQAASDDVTSMRFFVKVVVKFNKLN